MPDRTNPILWFQWTCTRTLAHAQADASPRCTGTVPELRDVWESTSFALERLQCAVENVAAEQSGLSGRVAPAWHLPFTPAFTPAEKLATTGKVRRAKDVDRLQRRCVDASFPGRAWFGSGSLSDFLSSQRFLAGRAWLGSKSLSVRLPGTRGSAAGGGQQRRP
jgi:hypothetical protein